MCIPDSIGRFWIDISPLLSLVRLRKAPLWSIQRPTKKCGHDNYLHIGVHINGGGKDSGQAIQDSQNLIGLNNTAQAIYSVI